MARELRDALLQVLGVAHEQVAGEPGVAPPRRCGADVDHGYAPLGEQRQLAVDIGCKPRVRDEQRDIMFVACQGAPVLALDVRMAEGVTPDGEQPVAEHLRGVQVVRLRVDADTPCAPDELGGAHELGGAEHLAGVAHRGGVQRAHLRNDAAGLLAGTEGEVDVHVGDMAGAYRGRAGDLDLELFEPLEADLFAEAVDACDRDAGRVGELLDGHLLEPLSHGEDDRCDLLLGWGEAPLIADASADIQGWLLSKSIKMYHTAAQRAMFHKKKCQLRRARLSGAPAGAYSSYEETRPCPQRGGKR